MTTTFRTHDGRTLEQAASDLVAREVLCCMSSMVATLAYGSSFSTSDREAARRGAGRDFTALCEQAAELAAPVLDYEEAAREAGWTINAEDEFTDGEETLTCCGPSDPDGGWPTLCAGMGIEPHEWEVYEHWAVSTWLAEKLQAAGERIDTDFAGLNVWARTTTGQAISIDAVIERITREMHAA